MMEWQDLCSQCGRPFLPSHGLGGDCGMFVSSEPGPAEAERAAIVAYMRDAITQGYPSDRPDKALCSHGTFSDEDCIGCYDEFLSAKLDAVESGDHLKDRPS